MESLFTNMTHAIEGSASVALSAALLWGVLSILLSPCHLASIPLIIGFIDNQGKPGPVRAFFISLLFATGILATIAAIGTISAAAGRMLGDIGRYGNYFVACIFFAVGLNLLGVLPSPFSSPKNINLKHKGLLGAFMLGLIFGIALGPCSFSYMAPMLAITFKLGGQQPVYAGSLLLMYGIGHCAVIVIAGTSSSLVQRYINWNNAAKGTFTLKRICGVLVLLGGLYLLYTA